MDFKNPKTWLIGGCIGLVIVGISFWTLGWPSAPYVLTPLAIGLIGAGIANSQQ